MPKQQELDRIDSGLRRELAINIALADLAKKLISAADKIDEIALTILQKAKELTGSDHGYVSLLTENREDSICLAISPATGIASIRPHSQPLMSTSIYAALAAKAVKSTVPYFINDAAKHVASSGGAAAEVMTIENFLLFPVLMDDQLTGHIVLVNCAGGFDESDVMIIDRLSDLYKLAIKSLRNREERENLLFQLRHSQKMEAIGTLAGGIAHDFNNILAAIMGFSELIKDGLSPGSTLRSYLDQVLFASNRAKELVQQILTFSRNTENELKPLQIVLIVKETLKLLRASIPVTIEIRSRIDPKCGCILAEPSHIHQVIMNLCTNAYQAMGSSGGVMDVELFTRQLPAEEADEIALPPGRYVVLRVSDTGTGMSEEVRQRIFEPYYTTKAQGQGTGLGLSVVHGIVTSHQGAINVTSRAGQGTIFTVYFPQVSGEVCQLSHVDEGPLPQGHEHIMVVDDEIQVVKVLQHMLQKLGYKVTALTDSEEALKMLREESKEYDLLVTDLTMPKMTGLELSRLVTELHPGFPVVLVTGFTDIMGDDRFESFGIRVCLKKPIMKNELAKAVRQALG